MGFSWRGKYWVQENEGGVTRCGRLTVSTGVEHGTDNGGSIGDSAVNTGLPRAVQRTLDQGTCLRLGPAQCRFERNIALRQLYGNKGHDEHEVVHGQCDTGTLLWCHVGAWSEANQVFACASMPARFGSSTGETHERQSS